MEVKKVLNLITNNLKDISTEPYSEAKIILENILSLSSLDIIINIDINYKKIQKVLDRIINERINKRTPIQYIFNNAFFYKHNFYVNENVLIPRPETELLVQEILNIYNENYKNQKVYIAELGTGSGCISLTLAKEIKNCVIYSTDISKEAIEVAEINRKLLKVDKNKVIFLVDDKLENVKNLNIKFDFIVSNPPYISLDDYNNLEKELYKEPLIALTDKNDGFTFYKYLAEVSKNLLKEKGILACEFAYNQKDKIINILKENNFREIFISKDFNNIDRLFITKT
jgi:release factor glutamine methyltransferase